MSIIKKCIYCQEEFTDNSKNHNKLICGSKQCKMKRQQYYKNKTPISTKRKWSKNFYNNHPDYNNDRYYSNIEECRKKQREYKKCRFDHDPTFKLISYMRSRLYKAVRKNAKTIELIGCSAIELTQYLESLFLPGMNWSNYGLWHVDHIKPLASFDLTDIDQLKIACNYKNLQPLWAKDNLKKSSKYEDNIQCYM